MNEDWKKEFDEQFPVVSLSSLLREAKIKDFISNLLRTQYQEIAIRIQDSMDKEFADIHYLLADLREGNV